MTDDDKSPIDLALDLFVYAPLGFALDARSLLPKLVDRGRDQVTNQVTMAKMVGQFAVQQGQSEATKHLAKVGEQATTVLTDLGILPREPAPAPSAAPEPEPAPAGKPAAARTTRKKAAATKPPAPAAAVGGDTGDLAIPDYDSLAASQVIPRLEGLAPAELDAVRAYEAGHRGRKTILNKIAQLQS